MKGEHKAFLGLVIAVGVLIGYAYFANALKTHGPWLWIPIIAVIGGNIGAAIKFSWYRQWLGKGIKGSFEAVAEYFTGGSAQSSYSERKAVPAALRRKIYSRARQKCQFPRCSELGSKRLDIHHIDMDPSNSADEDNLIAVCPNHHREIHNNSDHTTRRVRSWARNGDRSKQRSR